MNDLILIKKYYGEEMMHLCKKLFPTILEEEGKLFSILSEHFAYNKFLYEDIISQDMIISFTNFIYSFAGIDITDVITDKNPFELMEEAGYILYECKTEEEINSFKKYYKNGEELCTFDSDRLEECYVFFAVKKDVDNIKREDFKIPQRQDEYGVSVISIQFTRGDNNILSIKNRYNHKVDNPDATYSNNLELITPGLTHSFEKYYGLNINSNYKGNFELDNYVIAKDNKLYRYNYHIRGYFYCPNNIIIDNLGNIITKYQEKEKYLVMDYFIVDIVNKKVLFQDVTIGDSLRNQLKNIKKIEIKRDKENDCKTVNFILDDNTNIYIELNDKNQIIGYTNYNIKTIEDNFLYYNKTLLKINIPNVEEIKDCFLSENICLKEASFPNLRKIGTYFLYNNLFLSSFNAPNLERIDTYFLYKNNSLLKLELPNLKILPQESLQMNNSIIELIIPRVFFIEGILNNNTVLENLYAPSMKYCSRSFLHKHPNRKIILKNKKKLSLDSEKKL